MEFMSWSMHASESEAWARRKIVLFTLINMNSLEHIISTMGRMMMSQNFVCVDNFQWYILWKMLIYHVTRTPTRVRQTLDGFTRVYAGFDRDGSALRLNFHTGWTVDPPMQIIWHHFSALPFPISPIVVARNFVWESQKVAETRSLSDGISVVSIFTFYPHREKKSSSLSMPHLKLILFINHMAWAERLERVN